MATTQDIWETISILMENSFWGKNSSMDSLFKNLQDEVDEFIDGCRKKNPKNAIEEAGDVMMLLFCLLYRVTETGESNEFIDKAMDSIVNKLKRRYAHLYEEDKIKIANEKLVWQDAKQVENTISCMFCNNPDCNSFGKIGGSNIFAEGEGFYCRNCQSKLKPSKHTMLFYNKKNPKQYMQILIDSIIEYSRGDKAAPLTLQVDYEKIYNSFYKDVISNDKIIMDFFIEYLMDNYELQRSSIIDYCNTVIDNYEIKIAPLSDYCEEIGDENYLYLRGLPFREENKLLQMLKNIRMDVEERIEKVSKYQARTWNNQMVHKYLLSYNSKDKKRIIECMTIVHYKDERVKDLTVELSNMYNCIVGCRFCASGALPESTCYFEPVDYVKQMNSCLIESGMNPNDFENFYVSFAGIGEPSVVCQDIAKGMVMIRDIYPQVLFNVATFGFNIGCFEYWSELNLPIRTLQIPFYSRQQQTLKYLVKNLPDDYSFFNVLQEAVNYKKRHAECRVKINYIVIDGVNDKEQDVLDLCDYAEPFKDHISIRLSYLNFTKPGQENGLFAVSEQRMFELQNLMVNRGFTCYIFGSKINTELGCGQLTQNHISSL